MRGLELVEQVLVVEQRRLGDVVAVGAPRLPAGRGDVVGQADVGDAEVVGRQPIVFCELLTEGRVRVAGRQQVVI